MQNETKNQESEQAFLKNYNVAEYERPSVTADIVIFTIQNKKLMTLLIKRKNHPYKDKWAFPGGFLNVGKESLDQTAARELFEETHVTCDTLRQLATFSNPERDPRTHVVSVAYTALIHESLLAYTHDDDAADAELMPVHGILYAEHMGVTNTLAFDHIDILTTAVNRLQNRLDYTMDAFDLIKDQTNFTLGELQEIHEAILGKKLDSSNFRKKINASFIKTGIMEPTGTAVINKNSRPAKTYRIAKRQASDL